MGTTERPRAEVVLETQSPEVFPGQSLKGEVITKTEEDLKIKSAQLTLTCEEETHISPRIPFISREGEEESSLPSERFSGAYSRSVTTKRLTLRQEDTLSPPGVKFPFEVEIPKEALPSYSGRSATIGWWLEAEVLPISGPELMARSEVRVLRLAQRGPRRVVASTKPTAPVGLELEVFQDIVEPGDQVKGQLTITRLKTEPRRISVELIAHEFAKARQTVGYQIDTRDTLLTGGELFDREQLQTGVSQGFTLSVPEDTATYVGRNSSSRLLLKVTADLRFRRDVSLTAEVHVGKFAQS